MRDVLLSLLVNYAKNAKQNGRRYCHKGAC